METLPSKLMKEEHLNRLQKEDAEFWREMMAPFAAETSLVTVIGRPSKAKRAENEAKEKKYVEDRIKELGEEGLKEKAKILAEAKAQ